MVIRQCPKCGKPDTAGYGFCIYCGTEFPKQEQENKNPNRLNQNIQNDWENPRVNVHIDYNQKPPRSTGMNLVIIVGYILSIFGSILGLIPAIYLITRKDMSLKKHGVIQLAIISFYVLFIIMLFATGQLTMDKIIAIGQKEYSNMTQLTNMSMYKR
ncbi:MAG: hypothetical protein ACI4VU_04280 [Methanobrevibacter sp.]